MENHHFSWVNPLSMVISHSYVSLPQRNLVIEMRRGNFIWQKSDIFFDGCNSTTGRRFTVETIIAGCWNMVESETDMGRTIAGWWFETWILFFHSVGNHHPNWRNHIFQRGRSSTNQIHQEHVTFDVSSVQNLCWLMISLWIILPFRCWGLYFFQ